MLNEQAPSTAADLIFWHCNSSIGNEQSIKVCGSLNPSPQLCTKSAPPRLEQVVKESGNSEASKSICIFML